MKFINNKSITNKIIILLIFAIIINFTVPNYSYASDGGELFKPLFQFVCGIGDLVIMTLQKVFLGVATISDGNININERQYSIYYGPYNIFAGSIPILDINFVNPEEKNMQLSISKVSPSIQSITDALEMQNGAQEIENKVYGGNGILTLL